MALTKIQAAGLTADLIDETKLADNSIDSEHYNDGSIDNAHLADDAVGVAELSATGTASSSTFLRGDNSWATPTDTNTQLSTEEVQDIVGAMFTGNTETNITATYEDSDGTIDLVSTDTNTQLSTEQVQDIVGAMFTGNTETNITATYQDSDGTIDLVGSSGVGGATGVDFDDSVKARFGTDNDLEIYSNGSDAYIKNATGDLVFQHGTENLLVLRDDGAAELYHDNVLRAQTTAHGFQAFGNLTIRDDVIFYIGDGNDLQIKHDSTTNNSSIANSTGQLNIAGADVRITNAAQTESCLKATENGSVELYYDNSKKVETTDYGIGVTGTCFATSDFQLDDGCAYKAGTGNDLQIYHSGSHSYLQNTTSYPLWIQNITGQDVNISHTDGTDLSAKFNIGGSADLYYDGTKKFETSSGGVVVSGSLEVNGGDVDFSDHLALTTDDKAIKFGASGDLQIKHDGTNNIIHASNGYIQHRASAHYLNDEANSINFIRLENSAAKLCYGGNTKLETTSAGGTLHGTWTGAGGIQQYDEWVMTSNTSTSQNPIDSNWSRVSFSQSGLAQNMPIGSGMSASSGVFTFPTTGFWKIYFAADVRHSDGNMWTEGFIQATPNDGSNWYTVSQSYANQFNDSNWVYGTTTTDVVLDITDTSNQKVRFTLTFDESSNGVIIGKSDRNATYATFMKIADT